MSTDVARSRSADDAEARRLQRDVELAVLHQFDRFAEGQVLDFREVLVADARGGEDRPRVELGAGLRRAHRDPLALEVRERPDPGVGAGDDLDVVGIDRGDPAQLLQRRLESGFLVTLPGVRQRVAEREGDFAAAGLQQVQVLDRRLGRLHRGLGRGQRLADVAGERHAQRVVDAAGAAGEHVDEGVGGERRQRGECGSQHRDEIAQRAFHVSSRKAAAGDRAGFGWGALRHRRSRDRTLFFLVSEYSPPVVALRHAPPAGGAGAARRLPRRGRAVEWHRRRLPVPASRRRGGPLAPRPFHAATRTRR